MAKEVDKLFLLDRTRVKLEEYVVPVYSRDCGESLPVEVALQNGRFRDSPCPR